MKLKSLEIKGFKSFAKKTTFDFKAPISAIVGPNGSGKSNAVEAFRFVLGEQSMKSMRSKKGEDLLFNGSRSVSRSNRASVKITFDNTDRLLDIDFDEVTIERIVHRDASNEYRINGSNVRLKDITELLAKANIGASGHHIISQGEADKVLNINPRERREMIEDALGLKIYHYKIEKAEKKLEKTTQNLHEIQGLRRELRPRLQFLEKQVKKVKKAQELRKKLTQKYRRYFKREAIYLEHTQKKLNKQLAEPKEKFEKLKEEEKSVRKTIEENQKEDRSTKEEAVTKLKKELSGLRSTKDELSRKVGQVEGEIRSEKRALAREKKRSKEGVRVELKSVENLTNRISEHLSDLDSQNPTVLKQALQKIQRWLDTFVQQHRKQGQSEQSIEAIQSSIEELNEKKQTLQKKEKRIQKDISEVTTKYQALKQSLQEEKSTVQASEKRLLEIKAEKSSLSSRIQRIKTQLEQVRDAAAEFKEELGEAGMLINREATQYEDVTLTNETGDEISVEEILEEDRKKQRQRKRSLEKMKAKLESAQLDSSTEVIGEFEEVKERDEFLEKEIHDLQNSKEKLTDLIDELQTTLSDKFKTGVEEINEKFAHFFSLMFGGGEAGLSITKERVHSPGDEDVFEKGVKISVNLPYKRIKSMEMLSGGERALTSIALLFAITQINPPPFLVLDETDAALDEANSRKYGDLIEDLSTHSQLILITHNRETMSRADLLYGITMGGDGVSKLLSIEFKDAVKVAK